MADNEPAMGEKLSELFKGVRHSISSSELRSLWEKMQEEMARDGPDAAVRYLEDELVRCRTGVSHEMERLEADFSQRGSS